MNNALSINIARNKGFSLIEILVSLIVLSVGLMGLAGLQLASLKGANNAHYRTEGSLLMMDLADRMRANLDGIGDGKYLVNENTAINCTTAPSIQCDTQSCTGEQLAKFDIHTISCGIKMLLPGGQLSINCANNDCSAIEEDDKQILNKTHNIVVSWREAKDKNQDITENNTHETRNISLSIVP